MSVGTSQVTPAISPAAIAVNVLTHASTAPAGAPYRAREACASATVSST